MLLNSTSDPLIDRLRGISSLLVAVGHGMDVAAASFAAADSYYHLLQPWRPYLGFSWVIAFIVLSGFCIVHSTARDGANFSIVGFALMRVTRIFPMLVVCVLLAACVEFLWFGDSHRPGVWNNHYTGEAFRLAISGMAGLHGGAGQFGSIAPSYTITYELFYYLLWGLVVALMPGRTVLALAVSAVIGAAILAYAFQTRSPNTMLVLGLFPWLIGGCAVVGKGAWASRIHPAVIWVLLFVFYTYGLQNWAMPVYVAAARPWALVYFCALSLIFAAAIVCHLSRPTIRLRPDRWLGEISFPLFLVHGPVFIFVASLLRWSGFVPSYGVLLALMMGCSLIAAQLLVVTVERPVMAMRQALRRRKRLATSDAAKG